MSARGGVPLRRAASAVAAIVCVLCGSCRAPLPSAEPLGTEVAVSPGPPAKSRHRDRVARATEPAAKGAVPDVADDGGEPATKEPTGPTPVTEPKKKDKNAVAMKSATTAIAFVGNYAGDDVATYHLEGLPDRVEKDPNAKLNVKTTGTDTLAFVLIDSSNGKDICTLNGKVSETGTTIDPGQKCFEQSGEDSSTSATVTSGTAAVDGKHLVFELTLDFSMSFGDRDVKGTLEYRFDGKR